MTEIYQNNYITGTWSSGEAGFGPFAGEITTFNGTITATGATFTAVYYGGVLNVSALPGSLSTGGFTFNGTLEDFLGWSFGVTASAGVNVSYSTNTGLHSLVMYGAASDVEVGVTAGYTQLQDELAIRPYNSVDFWNAAIAAIQASDLPSSQKSAMLADLALAREVPAWREDIYDKYDFEAQTHCFPSGTAVLTVNGDAAIESLQPGDLVLAFDPSADFGRGNLVPKRVVRLFHNETEEWLRLTWREGGEDRELTVTPGHRFLDLEGRFRRIDEIIEDAAPTVVLADGSLAQIRAERIVWSEATRHLFDEVETVAMAAGDGLARRVGGA